MTYNIIDFDNYKDLLKKVVSDGQRGIIKLLAEAAGCQRSYLSQVLSTHIHLTSDHICGIADFLSLTDNELDYFLLLLDKEKASSIKYKQYVIGRLNSLKDKLSRVSTRLKKKSPQASEKINKKYYSAWYYSALHIASSIEQLKTESDFANYIGLGKNTVRLVFHELESWDFVEKKNGAWLYKNNEGIHLNDRSALTRMNHMNWRNQAMAIPLVPTQNLHYTSVFSISEKDVKLLRTQILKLISDQRTAIGNSGSEELVSFCCDFFLANTKLT